MQLYRIKTRWNDSFYHNHFTWKDEKYDAQIFKNRGKAEKLIRDQIARIKRKREVANYVESPSDICWRFAYVVTYEMVEKP